MRLLVDANIIVDVLLERDGLVETSKKIYQMAENSVFTGVLCANTITTINYIVYKGGYRGAVGAYLEGLFRIFEIAEVNEKVLKAALRLDFKDYEDAVIYQSAVEAKAKGIITRNVRDFKNAKLPVYTPEKFLKMV